MCWAQLPRIMFSYSPRAVYCKRNCPVSCSPIPLVRCAVSAVAPYHVYLFPSCGGVCRPRIFKSPQPTAFPWCQAGGQDSGLYPALLRSGAYTEGGVAFDLGAHAHRGTLEGGGRGAQSVNSTKRRLSLYQCKVCLLCLNFLCRRPTWGLHDDYMRPSWDLHKAYMRPAWGLNEAYMRYTWGLQYVRSTVYKACRTANE